MALNLENNARESQISWMNLGFCAVESKKKGANMAYRNKVYRTALNWARAWMKSENAQDAETWARAYAAAKTAEANDETARAVADIAISKENN